MSDEPVLLDIGADGVARLTLNRPDAANAIDVPLARALNDTTSELSEATGVRAVLLTGAGDRFCGGGDVRAFAAEGEKLGAALAEILSYLHPSVEALAGLDAPVIAAVQGSAAGAGLALVAGADLVLAAASAKFVLAYTGIGLVPDGGSTWYLPKVLGARRALELVLTNRVLAAEEAREWGLVTRVVADGDLTTEADALASSLATGPTHAFGAAKRLVRASFGNELATQLRLEAAEMVVAGESADGLEGVAAFAEKRPPKFSGS